MESSTVTLNGKEFDINNREECQACLQEVKDIRESLDDNFMHALIDRIYSKLEKALDEKLATFTDGPEEETEEGGFDWSIVDWDDQANCLADDYLTETFGDKYNELPDEDQYRNLKTVANVIRWYMDKYEK